MTGQVRPEAVALANSHSGRMIEPLQLIADKASPIHGSGGLPDTIWNLRGERSLVLRKEAPVVFKHCLRCVLDRMKVHGRVEMAPQVHLERLVKFWWIDPALGYCLRKLNNRLSLASSLILMRAPAGEEGRRLRACDTSPDGMFYLHSQISLKRRSRPLQHGLSQTTDRGPVAHGSLSMQTNVACGCPAISGAFGRTCCGCSRPD